MGVIRTSKENLGTIRASTRFKGWIQMVGWDYKELAKRCGYNEAFMSSVITGEVEPSKQLMKKLMNLTCMGMELFEYDPGEQGSQTKKK